jgi:hypothetical protein
VFQASEIFFSRLIKQMAEEEMLDVAKQLKLQSVFALAGEFVADLCQEVVADEVRSVAKDSIKEVFQERERKIEELRKRQLLRTGLKIIIFFKGYKLLIKK